MSCPVITCTTARLVAVVRPSPVMRVRVQPPARIVARLATGQGPAGPPGASGGSYTHTQALAATLWIVNHNLGFRPALSVLGVGGGQVWAQVIHTSANQAYVYFDSPAIGSAVCS